MSQPDDTKQLRANQSVIAFVIPVRDDAERLRTCLASLRADVGPRPHEVLVLDHGSRDRSGDTARDFGASVITRLTGNVASLRNLGVGCTNTTLIAFIDADHEIVPGWLDAALAASTSQSVGVVGAPCYPPPAGTWVQATYGALRRHPAAEERAEWLGAGNMVVRREAFVAVNGFDESLETCEDVDLCARIAKAGWQVRAVPGMRNVHHGDPERLSNVFWGELWRGRDNLRVTLRGPKTPRNVVSAAMPIGYAVAVAGILFGGLAGWPVGAALAGVGLAGVLALLTVRIAAMKRNAGGRLPAGLWAAVQVALAYDLGRSAAVFVGVGHGRRREGSAT